MLSLKSLSLSSALLASGLILTGCGGNDSSNQDHQNTPPTTPVEQTNAGRLIINNNDQAYTYDLSEDKLVSTLRFQYSPNALYTSPNGRYAIAVSQANNLSEFLDGGVYNHDSHVDINIPSILSYRLEGDKPAHYRSFNGQAVLFYDGLEAGSKFQLFTDNDISKRTVASQSLPSKHHGVAEPRGTYVLSSYTPTNWIAGDASNPLKLVRQYELHGDHFHGEDILETTCERLHGAASNKDFTLFGCADGVLAVEQSGTTFTDHKILIDQRISTLIGHLNTEKMVGFASGTGDTFIIDPKNKNSLSFDWIKGQKDPDGNPIKRIHQAFDHSGKYFFILDNIGQLYTIDTTTWTVINQSEVIHAHADEIGKSRIVANQATGHIYLNDTAHKSIIEFDPKTTKVVKTIKLDDVPTHFTWVGIAK